MRKSLITLGVIAALALTVNAQTPTLPPSTVSTNEPTASSVASDAWSVVKSWVASNPDASHSTNWTVIVGGTYAPKLTTSDGSNAKVNQRVGGVVAAQYPVNEYVRAGLRLDYFNRSLTVASFNMQLQTTKKIFGVYVTPFITSGAATPLGGGGTANGNAIGIVGAGGFVKVANIFGGALSIGGDMEHWTAFSGPIYHGGLAYSFHF